MFKLNRRWIEKQTRVAQYRHLLRHMPSEDLKNLGEHLAGKHNADLTAMRQACRAIVEVRAGRRQLMHGIFDDLAAAIESSLDGISEVLTRPPLRLIVRNGKRVDCK